MNAIKVSAQFAAYTWFTGTHGESAAVRKEARLFARRQWEKFLPCAHKGLGRLLIRLAGGRKRCSPVMSGAAGVA